MAREFDFDPLYKTDPDWFAFEWINHLVARWKPDEFYTVGALIRPPIPAGYYLQCSAAGLSGDRAPARVTTLGATVVDGAGGLEWTTVDPTVATPSLPASATYTIRPDDIAQLDDDVITAQLQTRVQLDAADAAPGPHRIIATMTDASGEEHSQVAWLLVVP